MGAVCSGVGGLLVDATGHRFVNELELRSNVVAAMRDNAKNAPFRLIMTQPMIEAFGPNIDFYFNLGPSIPTPPLHFTPINACDRIN